MLDDLPMVYTKYWTWKTVNENRYRIANKTEGIELGVGVVRIEEPAALAIVDEQKINV